MPKIIVETKFYTFRQNNSGGRFHIDDLVCMYVIVEATSDSDANNRAERIGIYFNGVERGRDCDCCGDRWSTVWRGGTEEPSIYGTPVKEYSFEPFSEDAGKVQCRVYYMNGEVKEYY